MDSRTNQLTACALLGTSPPMRQLAQLITQFAPYDVPLLITGEDGAKKRLVAELIHNLSPFRQGPFVAVDCAASSEMRLAVKLFGCEPGFHGGPAETVLGKLEIARGGTLFLEHVETLPHWIRKRLLHVLEHRSMERLGSSRPVPVRLRIVASTLTEYPDPEISAFNDCSFLDRLAGGHVLRVPPLRERRQPAKSPGAAVTGYGKKRGPR